MSTLFRRDLERHADSQPVALLFHIKLKDGDVYEKWLNDSDAHFGAKRLYRVKVDPVSREGMRIDEILIQKHPNAQSALAFLSAFDAGLSQLSQEYTILALKPEPSITFKFVKTLSWLIKLFKGVTDKGVPTENWKASNVAVWPDEEQMEVARRQDLGQPLFVYNLNKYKATADYLDSVPMVTGKAAYDRYAKIAGFELLRRGAYPVYGGKPICLYSSADNCMLLDDWDHFIFVRYPQRRNLFATIESDEFNKGQVHRDAGLERVAIFMANNV